MSKERSQEPKRPLRRSPPRPLATLIGAVLGALAALVFGLWEVAVVGRAGLVLPDAETLPLVVALQAGTGALLGFLVGFVGRFGASWWLGWVVAFAGWLLGGKLGMAIAESGGGAWAGPMLLVPGALAVGLIAGGTEIEDDKKAAAGTAMFVLLALGLPANLHLVGDPFGRLALLVDLAALLVAVVLTAVAWMVGAARDRHGPLVPLVVLGALGGGAAWSLGLRDAPVWPVATRADLPPIVLVVVDTLRADHLGVYGYQKPVSPRLDARARRALIYDDATAAAPWTLPSVASLLTGQLAARHGAGPNVGAGVTLSPLRPDVPYLPEELAAGGYVTAAITTNPFISSAFGLQRGLHRFDEAVQPVAMPAAAHPLHVLGLDLWPPYRDAATITDQALAFLSAQPRGGYFLLVHYMDVHGPFTPTEADRAAVGVGDRGGLVDAYDASIHKVDRELERLLAAVPSHAWVVLTSDHGEQLTEKRDLPLGAPLGTRHGHTLYQELLRVPLLVWGPRVTPRRVARPVSLLDVTPTLLAVAGRPALARAAGGALPEVVGGAPPERTLLADSVRWGPEQQAVREGDYKLIRRQGQGWRLYALRDGAVEGEDVQVAGSQDLQAIARRLEAQLPQIGLAALEGPAPLGFELRALLRRLGYLADDGEAAPVAP